MNASKSVKLPQHLWSALDDMSKDGAQSADVLMEAAVEQFVALQGYELPVVVPAVTTAPPVSKKGQAVQDEPPEYAATAARVPLPPEATPPDPVPRESATDAGPRHEPPSQPMASAPMLSGLMPTHVPTKNKPGPAPIKAESPSSSGGGDPAGAELRSAPAVTDAVPAFVPPSAPRSKPPVPTQPDIIPATPSAPTTPSVPQVSPPSPRAKPSAPVVPPKPAPPPAWAARAPLLDADEERSAAREHLEAIAKDLERLTIERPTTTPLGGGEEEEEEEEDSEK